MSDTMERPNTSPPEVHEVEGLYGANSWIFGNTDITVALTRVGAQMAPVTFRRTSDRPISPYYVAPWATQRSVVPDDQRMLHLMRGDVLCFPFGFPSEDEHMVFPLHGAITTAEWVFEGCDSEGPVRTYRFAVESTAPAGHVQKSISLVDGHDAIYIRHAVIGVVGRFPLGHHPMLRVPDAERSVLVGGSGSSHGCTWPEPFGLPTEPAYAAIAAGAQFDDLCRVPTVFGKTAQLDAFPDRRGFTDAVMWMDVPQERVPAWNTAHFTTEGYLWYSLKDARQLPMTILFMGNGGRHYEPWNGHERILSLQDLCGYFGTGAARSRASNPINEGGTPTTMQFVGDTTIVSHIQGVAPMPEGFGRVINAVFEPGRVTFVDEEGTGVTIGVRHEFATGSSIQERARI